MALSRTMSRTMYVLKVTKDTHVRTTNIRWPKRAMNAEYINWLIVFTNI